MIMFCTKCGYNAGDAKFCPKCGNALAQQAAPVDVTPVAPVEPVNVTPEIPVEPVNVTPVVPVEPVVSMDSVNVTPVAPVQPKKKKKWPLIAGIGVGVAALVAVFCFVFLPMIMNALSPSKKAKSAIKNAAASLEDVVDGVFDGKYDFSSMEKQELKGTITFDKIEFEGNNFGKQLGFDAVDYDVQIDSEREVFCGDFKLLNGSTKIMTVSMYTDGKYVYLKAPELFTESLRVPVTSSKADDVLDGLSQIQNITSSASGLGMMTNADMSAFKAPAKAAVKDFLKGIDKFVEKCEYKKIGDKTYESPNGNIKVTEFDITITSKALQTLVDTTIDAIFDDSDLKTYTSLLPMAGYSKDSLKSELSKEISQMKDVKFNAYVDDKDRFVRLSINSKQFGDDDDSEIAVSFVGDKNRADYIVFEAKADDTEMMISTNSNGKDEAELEMSVKQGSDTVEAKLAVVNNGKDTIDIKNMSFDVNTRDAKASVALSGKTTISEFSTTKYNASSFSNYIDTSRITNAQQTALGLEIMKNIDVLKKLVGDDLFKQYFSSLTTQIPGATTTTNPTTAPTKPNTTTPTTAPTTGTTTPTTASNAGQTNAQKYVTTFKTQLDAALEQTKQQYSTVMSDIKYYAQGNTIVYEYTYKPGYTFSEANLQNSGTDAQQTINNAKVAEEQVSGLKFDAIVFVYKDSTGKEVYRLTSNN